MSGQLCKDVPEYAAKPFSSVVDRFQLRGKKALITGAAGGIGDACARALAELGADVALMDLPSQQQALQHNAGEIASKYGVKAIAVMGDVSSEQSVTDFVAEAVEHLGTIDVLHNNAGIISGEDTADMPHQEWQRLMSVNVDGVMLVGRAVADVMIRHGHGGSIINTASMSGHIVNRSPNENYGFAYASSKAAVLHMTRAMAAQYIKHGIRVNSVSPGVVLSGIHDPVPASFLEFALGDVPRGSFGTLDDIAGIVAFLASDLSAFMVGSDVLADGGQCIN